MVEFVAIADDTCDVGNCLLGIAVIVAVTFVVSPVWPFVTTVTPGLVGHMLQLPVRESLGLRHRAQGWQYCPAVRGGTELSSPQEPVKHLTAQKWSVWHIE